MSPDIPQQRLLNQRIACERFTHPEEVVRWMGAMQAQDYQQAVWGIALRTHSATLREIEQAVADGRIVRTWPQRGTLHFVAPEDAQWMLRLSAQRTLAGDTRRLEQLELDSATLKRSQQLFAAALQGGRRLSRPQMMSLLEHAGITTDGQRGYHMLWHAAHLGLICMGPVENKQQTFALLDEWVPTSRQLSRDDSLAELARRYFNSHGPATLQDFAWWAGLTLTDARAGLAAVKSQLVSEKLDGYEYWLPDTPIHQQETSRTYLLPGFDEYLLGYKDRSAVLSPEHAQKIVPGNNGIFLPMIVSAGQVVGTWKRAVKKKGLDILIQPFITSPALEQEITEVVRRYCDFHALPLISMQVIV